MRSPFAVASLLVLLLFGCQSSPGVQATPDESPAKQTATSSTPPTAAYPDEGPPLRRCPDYESQSGEICRLTPVSGGEVRLRVRFPDSTHIDSTEPIPADLVRFRFLGRLEDFAACLIPASRDGWTGQADTAIKATLVGSRFDHVTMGPAGLPETATACFRELTRRLRVKRAPGPEARVTQPVVVHVDS